MAVGPFAEGLLMPLHEQSLMALLKREGTRARILEISLQLLDCIECIHNAGYVHCDIKPANVMMSKNGSATLIDFGFAHKYPTTWHKEGKEICTKQKRFKGTWAFCSLRTAKQLEPSRRDDLESLLYMMMHLLEMDLPWVKQHMTPEERRLVMRDLKTKTTY